MKERRATVVREPVGCAADDLGADREVAEQPALLGEPELGAVGELAHLADVVEERRRHQQVGVEPRVELADVPDQRPDRDRVLEQAAEVGVMAGARAGRPPELARQRLGEQHTLHDPAERRVVHLAGKVLEEARQLLVVAVRARQVGGRVNRLRVESADVVDLGHQLAAEALDPARHPDRVAPLEARGEPIDVAEGARGDRAGPVPQLQREIGGAVARREPVLAHAGVVAPKALPGPKLGDGRPGQRRCFAGVRLLGCLCLRRSRVDLAPATGQHVHGPRQLTGACGEAAR